jgi:hypothetical protein
MGKTFNVNLSGGLKPVGESRATVGRSHTGRSTLVDADYAVAREWSEAGDFDQILSHPTAGRFRDEIRAVNLVIGTKECVRGRPDDGLIKGWRDMGPPPTAVRDNRYNRKGDFAFYLCDSDDGVFREITSAGKMFLQSYDLPCDKLRIADFCDDRLTDFLKAVFDLAEARGFPERGGGDDLSFPQAVAQLVREENFDGMLVPGVRGEKGNYYQNVVILIKHPWEEWSRQDPGFCLRGAGMPPV